MKGISDIKTYLSSLSRENNFKCFSYISAFFSHYKTRIVKILLPFLVILVGFYTCSNSQRAIKDDVQDIFAITDEIRSFYTDKPDYWGLNTDFVIQNKIIPSVFIRNNKLLLRHGTEIQIGNGETADILMPSSQNFDIIIKHLTKAQCISYAEILLTDEQLLKLEKIDIINRNGTYTFAWGGERKLPIEKYATKNICLDGSNTLIWTLK